MIGYMVRDIPKKMPSEEGNFLSQPKLTFGCGGRI